MSVDVGAVRAAVEGEGALGMAVYAVCDELEYLRGERAAVVAWLRRQGGRSAWMLTDAIERGDHRREEKP